MYKYLTFIAVFLFGIQLSYSQVTLDIADVTTDCNDNINVPVTVANFNMIVGVQFTIEWDASELQFVNLNSLNATLGLSNLNFNINNAGTGLITFAWFSVSNPNGFNLNDGTPLFAIQFLPLAPVGTTTPVIFTSSLTAQEVDIPPFTAVQALWLDGSVTVGDSQNPMISCPGPINIQAPQGASSVVVTGLTPNATDDCGTPAVTYTISGTTSGSGSNTANGTSFNIGNSVVQYTATDAGGNTATCNVSVTITPTVVEDPLVITAGSANVVCGQQLTIPVVVTSGFTDILSFQFGMTWDPAILQYTGVSGLAALPGFDNTAFVTNLTGSGLFGVVWDDTNNSGENLNNGTTLFNLQFNVIPGVEGGSPLTVGNTNITMNATAPGMPPTEVPTQGIPGSVVLIDNTAPSLTCPANVNVDAGGASSIVINNIGANASDACGSVALNYQITGATGGSGNNNASGTSFNVGVSTVVYTATDINGNTSNCSFTVNVTSTNPVLTLIAESEVIQCNGEFGITVSVNGFTQLTSLQFSMNWNGNVIDFNNIGALANLQGLNLNSFGTLNAENGTITFSWFDPDLSGETLAPGTNLFTIFFLGDGGFGQSTNVSFTSNPAVIEAVGTGFPPIEVDVNIVNGNVQITDTSPPTISCPGDIEIAAPDGASSIVINGLVPVVNDNCIVNSVTYSTTGATVLNGNGNAGGQSFNVGITTVVYTATDIAGLTSTCDFQITVLNSGVLSLEMDAPDVSCGEALVVPVVVNNFSDLNSLQFTIAWDESVLDYNSIGGLVSLQGLNMANFGTTQVNNGILTFSWSDPDLTGESLMQNTVLFNINFTAIGNSLSSSAISFVNSPTPIEAVAAGFPPQEIDVDITNTSTTIIDNTPPQITCPDDLTIQATIGQTSVVVNAISPLVSDNCGIATVAFTAAGATFLNGNGDASGNAFNLGTTLVTYIATDQTGNFNTCAFTITINAPDVLTLIAPTGTAECGSEFDVDITVDNFVDITNLQFSFNWDPAVIGFINASNLNATLALTPTNLGITQVANGILTFSWFGVPGVTLNDGDVLFTLHFSALNSDLAALQFVNVPVVIEASQEGFPPVEVLVQVNNGFITVEDTQAPVVISCPQDITVNATQGTCSNTATWTLPVFDDACDANLSVVSTHNPGAVFTGPGSSPVVYTATDDDGNSASCTFNVIVNDNQPPIWSNCPPFINAQLPEDTCSAIVLWTTPTASDNCDNSLTIVSTHNPGAQFNTGATTVIYTATDDAGNSAICSFVVTLSDTVAPLLICPTDLSVSVPSDICQVIVTWDAPLATDNCADPTVSSNATPGSTFIPGVYSVVYTATDASGNTSSCSFNIVVSDNTPPTVTGCPDDLTFPAMGNQCTGIAQWTPPVFVDNCDPQPDILSNFGPGNEFPLGTFTVNYTATDNAGNTAVCSFTVTISDQQAPELVSCAMDMTVSAGPDSCEAVVFFDTPVFNDLCDLDLTITGSNASGSVFPVGNSVILFTATDDAGLTATCSFSVAVVDQQLPEIVDCPFDITVESDPGQCGANVSWPAPTASDNCPGLILNTADSNGGFYPVGTTSILYTATDASQNTATCTFQITVTGNTSIIVEGCPDNMVIEQNLPGCTAIATWLEPVITGDCNDPNFTVSQTHASGSIFQLGSTTVTYTVTTQSGSTDVCVFEVLVTDTVPPSIASCPDDLVIFTTLCDTAVTWQLPDVTDQCSAVDVTASANPGEVFPLGTTQVSYVFTDASSNSSNCDFSVTVIETTPPVFTFCPDDITLALDENCQGVGAWQEPEVSDNCTSFTLNSTHLPGDIFNTGTVQVTYTATDLAGNESVCTFNVTVQDTEPPVFNTCPDDITVDANLPGCSALAAWLEPDYSDNCGSDNVTVIQSHFSGTEFPLGQTIVTYTITDPGQNTAVCSFSVWVVDNQPPVITFCPDDITIEAFNCEAVANFDEPTAVDNCGTLDYITNVLPGTVLPVGITNVVYSIFDLAGNMTICDFSIFVQDNDSPFFISCPNSFAVQGDENCTAVVIWDIPVALDFCDLPVLTSTHDSGDLFTAGATVVIYTATDASGNSDLCSFVVTVTGGELGIVCPANVIVESPFDVCAAQAFWPAPTLTGNCDLSGSFVSDFNSGDFFPLGLTTVTYLASNFSGDEAFCDFTVLVLDVTPPVFESCPDDLTISTSESACTAPADYGFPVVTDNCTVSPQLTANIQPGDELLPGCHDIVLIASDENGNISECTFQICVEDQVPPSITCPGSVVITTSGLTISDPDGALTNAVPVDCESIQLEFQTPVGLDLCEGAQTVQTDNTGLGSGSIFSIGTYSLEYTVTDANGSTANCIFNIEVQATPSDVQPVASPSPICGMADVTISVPGVTGVFTWEAPDGTLSNEEVLVIPGFDVNNAGIYQVDVILTNGCEASGFVEVTVGEVVEIEVTSNGLSCQPADLQLSGIAIAGNPTLWNWTGPNGFSSSSQDTIIAGADNGDAGTYVLTACNDAGCCSEVSIDIDPAQSLGLPLISATDLVVCQGGETTLTATDFEGATYSWSATSTSTAGLPADTQTNPITVHPTGAGIYTYFVVAEANGCTSEQGSIFITVLSPPDAVLSSNAPLLCIEGTTTLELFETGGEADTWSWTGPNTADVQNPVFEGVDATDAGWYTVEITNAAGCTGVDSILIEITGIPGAPDPFAEDISCLGGTLQLFVDNFPPGAEFSWTGPNGFVSDEESPIVTGNIQPFHAGDYFLTLIVEGCESPVSAPVTVVVLEAPVAVADQYDILDTEMPALEVLLNDTFAVAQSGVTISITNDPFNGTAEVDNENGLIIYDPNDDYSGGETFSYQICYDICPDVCSEAIVQLTVTGFCLVPNIITPNGDGLNDQLFIPCLESGKFNENEIIIYNEWGDEVFSAQPYNNDWEGTYEGKPLPDGTYFYNFRESVSAEWVKGFITVYR